MTENSKWQNGFVKRSGTADLPLHGGRVPPWLAARTEAMGGAIAECVVHHYGRPALLARLSDPFWFQAFGSVMGMDWHSSGITTSVMAALKRANCVRRAHGVRRRTRGTCAPQADAPVRLRLQRRARTRVAIQSAV